VAHQVATDVGAEMALGHIAAVQRPVASFLAQLVELGQVGEQGADDGQPVQVEA
jgi:hypothetical protein